MDRSLTCASCGADLRPAARFCDACGTPVSAAPIAPPALPLPSAFGDGRYQVREYLGEGGRKRVYRAFDTRLDRDVAIAVVKADAGAPLDEASLARVRREARAMGRLGDHPHIVTVYDIGEDSGQLYIVSQYMAGGDVDRLLRAAEHHRLPLAQALQIAMQVCDALAHAHAQGIVHRDLKPGNVWLTQDGTVELGDFGLAVSLETSRLTAEGMMLGTVAYMPPEQALGRSPDARSDLYALGAMLYEMVTGRPPFLGDDAVAVISQHINVPPVAPSWHNPAVPPGLEALILRLLAKAPEDRPQSASAVREALAAIAAAAAAFGPSPLAIAPEVNPLDRLAGGVFVGREAVMNELRAGVDTAMAGQGRLVLLVGEPGIGKTRTADELATYARLRLAQVLVGRCYEGEGAPAYWPWVQALRTYVHERDTAALLAEMGSGAADIAQVVSELRERLPDLPTPPLLEPEQARFRLFDSITTFLKNAATRQPLVLVLATYRDVELRRQHPLSQALGELAREHLSQRIILRGITAADVARFIEMTAGKPAPAGLVDMVYRETEGNPFFVSEIVRLLVADGRLDRWEDGAEVSIPQSVREVIGRRLDRLSEPCNQLLTVASVIGREFALSVLESVGGTPTRERVLDLLEEAMAARVVAEVPHVLGRYSFSHALIRETLYEELSTMQRVRVHRHIGEVLEQLYATNLEPHLAEVAYHFFEAAPGGDVERAIDYAVRAAQRATTLVAYEEAALHYGRALQAMELRESADETRRCQLLLRLGEAQRRAGDFAKARATFVRAASAARNLVAGNPAAGELLAWSALGHAEEGIQAGRVDRPAVALLEESLGVLPRGDGVLRAEVLARLANQLYFIDRTRTVSLSQQAVEMARRVGDPTTLARALASRRVAQWNPQNVNELMDAANEIARLAQAGADPALQSWTHEWRIAAFLQAGDLVAVDREIEAHARLAHDQRLPMQLWLSTSWRTMRALADGRFEEAEQLCQQAFALGQRLRVEDTYQTYVVQMLILRREQGRLRELESTVLQFTRQYPQITAWRCGLAFVYAATGRESEARREFEQLAANDFAAVERDILWIVAVTMLAEVCAVLGDAARAAQLYQLLLPLAEAAVVLSFGTLYLGSAARALGILAATMGRWVDAEAHFEAALRVHRRVGARPSLAHVCVDYAAMLLARDASGDRVRAVALLNEALELAQAVGMQAVTERATALKLDAQGITAVDLATSIDSVASTVQRQRPDLRQHMAPDGTVTLMFSDMEGFTTMTERLGDHEAHKVIRAHNAIVREQVTAHGGFEVELQGDGFLLAFADPHRAVQCAIAIQRAFAAYSTAHPEQPIRVRIGLHTGEAITEVDRFFGKTVILAARIAAQAHGGEILVSSHHKQLIDGNDDVIFGVHRRVTLKGLAGAYTLHRVEWAVV